MALFAVRLERSGREEKEESAELALPSFFAKSSPSRRVQPAGENPDACCSWCTSSKSCGRPESKINEEAKEKRKEKASQLQLLVPRSSANRAIELTFLPGPMHCSAAYAGVLQRAQSVDIAGGGRKEEMQEGEEVVEGRERRPAEGEEGDELLFF